jgi:hypothetical protein
MRYCRSCRKWNTDWPFRCRYCRAGLEGRLCPSGHVNPPDASLAFCGECGKPLEQKWGAGFSIKPYALGFGVAMLTLLFSLATGQIVQTDSPLASGVIVLIIVIAGFRLSFRILPPWVGKFIGDIVSFLMRRILGTGIKGKK